MKTGQDREDLIGSEDLGEKIIYRILFVKLHDQTAITQYQSL